MFRDTGIYRCGHTSSPYAGETAGVWLKRDDSMLLTYSWPPGVLLELVARRETHDTVILRFKGDVSSLPGQSIAFKFWIDGRSHTCSYPVKTNFLIITSHEMRTPLTIIKGYNEVLLSHLLGSLSEVQKRSRVSTQSTV